MPRRRMIDPHVIWESEFRGFFFAEGNLDVQIYGPTKSFYRPRARVGLRDDNEPTLRDIQLHLGGDLSHRKANRSTTWQLSGKKALIRLMSILSSGTLPANKRREVAIFRDILHLQANHGGHAFKQQVYLPSQKVQINCLIKQLRELKRYEGNNNA